MPGADLRDILRRYDADERYWATYPGLRREEAPHLIRHVDLVGGNGTVIYSRLSAPTADMAIQDQIAYFQKLGQNFEWKAYAHDQPADLLERLANHGFEIEETEAILVLDLQDTPPESPQADVGPEPPADHPASVRRLKSRDDLADVASIRNDPDLLAHLAFEMDHVPEHLSVYVADVEGAAAACGWIRFPNRTAFASLWGGTTRPEMRKRGLYTALVAARLDEARQRGVRYVTVDARRTSRPILEKRGFQLLTYATPCIWHA